jgi:hypothetical protein
MPRRSPNFTKGDAVRAYRAAISAGVPNPRIEITREGTIAIFSGDPAKNGSAEGNELDKWMSDHAGKTERA